MERGLPVIVFEKGAYAGAAIAAWGHVRVFSPWRYNIDAAADAMLDAAGWRRPDEDDLPTGAEILRDYLKCNKLERAGKQWQPKRGPTKADQAATIRSSAKLLPTACLTRSGRPILPIWVAADGQPAFASKGLGADAGACGAGVPEGCTGAQEPLRPGLTTVFLDNDAGVIARLRAALGEGPGRDFVLERRRAYQEITGLVREGAVDAAWICGYSYLQPEDAFTLLGEPGGQGKPLYRPYLITAPDDPAVALTDLKGDAPAFFDPDSNSGWLVTAKDLARIGPEVEPFFGRTLFTYGHRKVVRAVAGGLTRLGSVDGYALEALAVVEPALTARTKIIAKPALSGFPPFVARMDRIASEVVVSCRDALLGPAGTSSGTAALVLLQRDGVVAGDPSLFDGIRARMRDLVAPKQMRFSNLSLSIRVPLIAAGLMVQLGMVASQLVLSALAPVQDARAGADACSGAGGGIGAIGAAPQCVGGL